MANTRSALKRMRQSEKRRVRNAAVRSQVRTAVKTTRTALAAASVEDARAGLARAIRLLDKAVTKGVVHDYISWRLRHHVPTPYRGKSKASLDAKTWTPKKKVGVPFTPILCPSCKSLRISVACFPLLRHS